MTLNLNNPLVFFDLETTGINVVKDRIVEIGYLKIYPNGNEEGKVIRVNPTIPIPQEATDVHGISNEDVAQEPTFKEIAKSLSTVFEGADVAGFNSNRFDIPLLAEEFLRADVDIDFSKRKCIDVQVIFHKKEPRTLSAAYQFYCNQSLENAHSAMADTKATYEILKAQLDRYDDLENDMSVLSEVSKQNKNVDLIGRIIYNNQQVEVFNFGKYKGQSVIDVLGKDPSYYSWMMNGDFPSYTKKILTKIKLEKGI